MSNWLLLDFKFIFHTGSYISSFFLFTNFWYFHLHFFHSFHHPCSAIHFPLPYFVTIFPVFVKQKYLHLPFPNLTLSNAVEIFYDDHIRTVHPSLDDNMGKTISMKPPDLCQNSYNELFIRTDHFKGPNVPPGHGCERHAKKLFEFMFQQSYNYSPGTTNVFFFCDCN